MFNNRIISLLLTFFMLTMIFSGMIVNAEGEESIPQVEIIDNAEAEIHGLCLATKRIQMVICTHGAKAAAVKWEMEKKTHIEFQSLYPL